jgi:hypothetical protein
LHYAASRDGPASNLQDSLAIWSKALASGASRLKPHSCHSAERITHRSSCYDKCVGQGTRVPGRRTKQHRCGLHSFWPRACCVAASCTPPMLLAQPQLPVRVIACHGNHRQSSAEAPLAPATTCDNKTQTLHLKEEDRLADLWRESRAEGGKQGPALKLNIEQGNMRTCRNKSSISDVTKIERRCLRTSHFQRMKSFFFVYVKKPASPASCFGCKPWGLLPKVHKHFVFAT